MVLALLWRRTSVVTPAQRLVGAVWHVGTRSLGSVDTSKTPDEHSGHAFATGENGDLVPIDSDQEAPKVYRRSRVEHQRNFRWGIGNAFRMQSENRFRPVHKEHPTETVVRDDYYKTENPNVRWEELNESWEVYWHEHNKVNARPFPVKKFGVERAKKEAMLFHAKLQDEGRLQPRREIESPQPGVFFDRRLQSWVCLMYRGGRPLSRCYSATKYGFEGARELAAAKQRDPVNGLLHCNNGRGPPRPS